MQSLKDALDLLAPGWVGSIIGIVGIAAAAVTYFLTRQRGLLVYGYAGERLLGLSSDGLPKEITVQYQGQPIQRLTRTLVVFWNAGEKTILADDVVKSDLLRAVLQPGSSVLAATVLKEVRTVSGVSAAIDPTKPNEVELRFAFLDSGDGAVVEILHTAEGRDANLLGTVRGLPHGIHDIGRIARGRLASGALRFSPRRLGWMAFAVGAAVAAAGLFLPWHKIADAGMKPESERIALVAGGAVYALMGFALVFLTRRRYPKSLHVDELD